MNRRTGASTRRKLSRVWGFAALLFLALSLPCLGEGECPTIKGVILSGEVNVSASCECWAFDDPDGKRYDCEIYTERNGKKYRSTVSDIAEGRGGEDPLGYLREQVNWKDGFLFVPESCGTGNMSRCHTDYVFTVRDGQLICLGSISGARKPDGSWISFEDGLFYDGFDGLELNALTCHADSPHFGIVMTERRGQFAADLNRTWDFNAGPALGQHLEQGGDKSSQLARNVPSLLRDAALARYCDREKELERALSKAKRVLSDPDFEEFQRLVHSVLPGEIHRCPCAGEGSD